MAELKQHAWLLTIIALLAVIKFVVLPVFAWQDNLLAEISLLEKKQNKINHVLRHSEKNKHLSDELTQLLAPANQLLYPLQTEASFKLQQQKMFETLLAKHKLTVQDVGWKAATPYDELAMVRYPIDIRFTGNTLDVIEFISELESATQRLAISSFNFSFKGQSEKRLGRVNGKVTLHLFLRQDEQHGAQKTALLAESLNMIVLSDKSFSQLSFTKVA